MSALFSTKYISVTFRMIIVWLSNYFVYYAITLLLPTILQKLFFKSHSSRYFEYIYLAAMSVLQLGCFAIAPVIMNHPNFRRKRTLSLAFIVQGLCGLIAMFFGNINPYFLFVFMALIITVNSIAESVVMLIFRCSISTQQNCTKLC